MLYTLVLVHSHVILEQHQLHVQLTKNEQNLHLTYLIASKALQKNYHYDIQLLYWCGEWTVKEMYETPKPQECMYFYIWWNGHPSTADTTRHNGQF